MGPSKETDACGDENMRMMIVKGRIKILMIVRKTMIGSKEGVKSDA